MEDSLSTNNLVRVVVSVLLAVIIVGAVLIPLISSTTTVEKENSGYSFRATGDYGEYVYEWDSDSKDLMLNGERLDYNSTGTSQLAIGVHTSNLGITNIYNSGGLWFEAEGFGAKTAYNKVTIASDGSWSAVKGEDTVNSTVPATGQGFFAKNDGEYAVYISNNNVPATTCVKAGDPVYLFCNYGQYVLDNVTYGIIYQAKLVDGVLEVEYIKSINSTTGEVTDITDTANIQCVYDDMTTENGVTKYTNLKTGVSYGTANMQLRCLHAVPLIYTEQDSGITTTILTFIPVFIVLGIIMAVCRIFITTQGKYVKYE